MDNEASIPAESISSEAGSDGSTVHKDDDDPGNITDIVVDQKPEMTPALLRDGENKELTTISEENTNLDLDARPVSAEPEVVQNDSQVSSRSTSRIPKMSSRAALSRTPLDRSSLSQEAVEETDGVLITELRVSDSEDVSEEQEVVQSEDENEAEPADEQKQEVEDIDVHVEREEEVTLNAEVETVQIRVADEDYDTDLEDEVEDDENMLSSYYRTVCEQLNLVPVEYFLRQIQNSNIRMRYRGLGSDATKAIALALKDNFNLEKLDIGGNWIGPEGARFMSRLLEENDYIVDVSLPDNKIGSKGGEHLANMMRTNTSLRRLNLSGNEFDDTCVEAISSALENNKFLRELDLSYNQFSDWGANFLGLAIGANENLDVLDLSWNHLRENGGIAIAKGLKENVRLKKCNLSWNGLAVAGGLAVVDALSANQSLLEIDISGNRLTKEVADKMAKVLTINDTIKVLKMGNNQITSCGALTLASTVNNTESCELQELDLTDVPVEYEFLRTCEDIRNNRSNFLVRHGPVMRAGNTQDDLSKPAIDIERIKKEPVVILQEHIIVNDMRLLDILKRYDAESSLSIAPEDFIKALEELAVPYNKKRLEDSVKKFSAASTGKIYFGSFVSEDMSKEKTKEKTEENQT